MFRSLDAYQIFNRTTWDREIRASLSLKFKDAEPELIWSRQVNFAYSGALDFIIGEVLLRGSLYQLSAHAQGKLRIKGNIGYDLFESEQAVPDVPAGVQSGVAGEVLPCSFTPASGAVVAPSQFLLVPLGPPYDMRATYQAGLLYGSFNSRLVADFERASSVLRMWLRAFEAAGIDYTKVKRIRWG